MLIARQQKRGFVIQGWTNTHIPPCLHNYLHTYIPTYLHTKSYKPYIPLQTDKQNNAFKRTPTYIQTYILTWLHTYNIISLLPYPTTPTIPYKPYPTLHLNTNYTCAIRIKNRTGLYLKITPPWEGRSVLPPQKTATLGGCQNNTGSAIICTSATVRNASCSKR